MDLLALVKVILRRWYVVLPVVAAAVGVAAWMQLDTAREYQSMGTLILSPPEHDPARSPSVAAAVASAVQDLRSSAGVDAIVEAGGSDDFSVTRLEGLQVQVTVPDQGAEDTVELVMERIAQSVLDRQLDADIPEDEQIRWRTAVGTGSEAPPDDLEPDEDDPTSASTVGLLTIEDPTAGRSNPFSANDTTARLLQYAIQSDAGRLEVFQRVAHPEFRSFSVAPQSGPGILSVSTTAGDPMVAHSAFDHVAAALEEELSNRQDRAEVPTNQRLVLEVLAAPAGAVDVTAPVNRGAAAIVALGGLLAVALAILVENVAYRRRLRRGVLHASEIKDLGGPPSDARSEDLLGSR